MTLPSKSALRNLVCVVVVFVVAGPIVLAAVFGALNHYSSRPIPQVAALIPLVWWVGVFTLPAAWRFTLLPTVTSAVLLWAAVGAMSYRFPSVATSRSRIMLTAAILGALTSLISWEIVSLLFDHEMLSKFGHWLILLWVVPTGAIVGALYGLLFKQAP